MSMKLKLPKPSNARGRDAVIVPVLSFAPEPYQPIRDIRAVVEETRGGFSATLYDANLSMCGETETEAIDGLKGVIIHTYEFLEKQKKLGPALARQFAVLKSLVSRTK
jgi:hypothetical protein